MTSINLEKISITYGATKVIENLDLTIDNGEFFTLLGPSGCGKTTLLRTIAGFITPSHGQIEFGGKNVTSIPTHQRNIGMVFQDYALFPDKTVNANVAYGLKARKIERSAIPALVDEALDRVGMGGFGSRLPGELSGGQRQRVALARALVIKPSVLLMDEPLSNLDTKLRIQIRESITDLQRELGITTVFVTHDQEEALAMSNRIALFKSGKIEQIGSPTSIYSKPVSSYAADFIGAANVLKVSISDPQHRENTKVVVRLGDYELRGLCRSKLNPGNAFAIARPEHLRLAHRDTPIVDAVSSIPGEVIRHQYLGRVQQHSVKLPCGSLIETSEPATAQGFAAGQKVQVFFPVDQTLVMSS